MEQLLIIIFILGYLGVAMEHTIKVDKAASALILGILTWTVYMLMTDKNDYVVVHELYEHVGEIAGVLFFLLGAMTIVELIDAHDGFDAITTRITTHKKILLLWIICTLTFFLSAALDNLTTTIVMISMLRKLVKEKEARIFFICMVVISANAGGAWSPIGDVTTTMLWIGGQITSTVIIVNLILPSLVCMLVPLVAASFMVKGKFESPEENKPFDLRATGPISLSQSKIKFVSKFERRLVLTMGLLSLLFVPLFKSYTHLPPFMGILLSLGFLWMLTELLHKGKTEEIKDPLSVIGVLRKVDVPSVLFFFGILVGIACLQTTGILHTLADFLDASVGNIYAIGLVLGLLSAIVDNVPLVAAAMGMYPITQFPTDHLMWQFIAYCAGTGGSALIIGSAAGVAAMGMERISFVWYIKKISLLALLGYFAGAATFALLHLM